MQMKAFYRGYIIGSLASNSSLKRSYHCSRGSPHLLEPLGPCWEVWSHDTGSIVYFSEAWISGSFTY